MSVQTMTPAEADCDRAGHPLIPDHPASPWVCACGAVVGYPLPEQSTERARGHLRLIDGQR